MIQIKTYSRNGNKTNGLSFLTKEELWPEPEFLEVRPAWEFKCGIVISGLKTEDLPEWTDILKAHNELIDSFDI